MNKGDKFGEWTLTGDVARKEGYRGLFLVAICSCGRESSIRGNILRDGRSTKCQNCANKKHGLSDTKEYQLWKNIINRCGNKDHSDYHRYGARGITVCERWQNLEFFCADVGIRPEGMTLDRKSVV